MTKVAAALLLAGAPIGAVFAADSGGWDWSITPYAWLPAVGTDIHIDVPPIDTGGTKQFSAIRPKLGFTIPLHLEGQGDDWGLLSDLLYLPVSSTRSGEFIHTDTSLDAGIFELAAVWSPGPDRHEGFEAIGGLRYLWASIDFKLIPNNPDLPSAKISPSTEYPDLMLGARYTAKLSDRWALTLRADGSWGSTDGTYGADAVFTYATSNGGWVLGYRYLSAKFSDADREFNMKMYGPEVGYAFNF
jgi:hypothetical protein